MKGHPQCSRLFDDLEILARSDREKKEMTEGFATSPYRLNADVKDAERWTEDAMRARSQRLATLALDYCTFAETDFRPPEVVRPTEPMGTDTSFRNRPVTAYEYGDASETVTDWADLLPKVLAVLLQQDRARLLTFAESETLLSTEQEDLHSDIRGLRLVDPGLGVWVNTGTDTKVNLLRRIFTALDLDPDELVFTLRPTTEDPDEPTRSSDSGVTGIYSALTKFRDEVAEARALNSPSETTARLRAEFTQEFAAFQRETWMQDLSGQPLAAFTAATPSEQMTAEQVLAVISGILAMETMFGPGSLHRAIVDGDLSSYLERLSALG